MYSDSSSTFFSAAPDLRTSPKLEIKISRTLLPSAGLGEGLGSEGRDARLIVDNMHLEARTRDLQQELGTLREENMLLREALGGVEGIVGKWSDSAWKKNSLRVCNINSP